ncbi:MAG: hypothetical protein ACAH11_16030 [Sphingomonas sp.]
MLMPVARAQFEIPAGSEVAAIGEVVRWIARRAGTRLGDEAFEGEPFTTGLDAAAPAMAVRGTVDGANYWGARLRFDDTSFPGRSWHTEAVIGGPPDRPAVAARLSVLDMRERLIEFPITRTAPGFLRQIVENVGGDDGPLPLISEAIPLEELDDFRALVLAEHRSFPVLVFAEEAARDAAPEIARIASQLSGIAHVGILSSSAARDVSETCAKAFTVLGNCAKLYFPIRDMEQIDPYLHPLFNIGDYSPSALLSLVLQQSRGLRTAGPALPRYGDLASGTESPGDAEETQLLALQIEELELELATAHDLLEQTARTERAMADERRKIESQLEEMKSVNGALSEMIAALPAGDVPDRMPPLRDMAVLKPWCAIIGGKHLVLTDTFLDEMSELPDQGKDYLYRVATALHGIAKLAAGKQKATGQNIRLEGGVELCPCGSIDGFPQYSFIHKGENLRSEWHAKWGTGTDIRYAFRIYFDWNTDKKRVVLQSINVHFDNKFTN